MVSQLAVEGKHPDLLTALNDFIGSVHFMYFISNYMKYRSKTAELAQRLDVFKDWLIQHNEKPPKDLLKYAVEVNITNEGTPAADVMYCDAELKLALLLSSLVHIKLLLIVVMQSSNSLLAVPLCSSARKMAL